MSNEQPEHPPATHSQSPANRPEAGSPAAEQRNGHLEDVGGDTSTKPTGQDPPPADELSAQTNDPAGTAKTDARLEGQQQDQASDRNDVPARPDTDTVATERTDTSISTQRPGEGHISEAPGALLFSAGTARSYAISGTPHRRRSSTTHAPPLRGRTILWSKPSRSCPPRSPKNGPG